MRLGARSMPLVFLAKNKIWYKNLVWKEIGIGEK